MSKNTGISVKEQEVDATHPLPVTVISGGGGDPGDPAIVQLAAGTNNIGDVDVTTLPDVRESWRISTLSFSTADDSDNTFTVPATTEYQILSIHVSLATSGDAGNRQLAIQMTDASDVVIGRLRAGIVQAASLTRLYQWGPGLPQETAFRDTDYIAQAMMPIFLSAGQKLRVYDKAAIAAAADDMIIKIQVASRSVA